MSIHFVTLSVAQCLPVGTTTTTEKTELPLAAAAAVTPEIFFYEYAKNDTVYTYR